MFRTWVSLVAFYVALKTGGDVIAPVVAGHQRMILLVTVLYFAAWACARQVGMYYLSRSRNAVYCWLRDSGVFAALMSYLGLAFIIGGAYLATTDHASLALLFAVLGVWLIASMLGIGTGERNQREA